MTKNRSECIDTARQALNLFTGDELHEYIKQVASETRELQAAGVAFPRNAAINNINKTHLAIMVSDSARAARDMGKWETIKGKLNQDISPKSFLDKTAKNTDYNIETANNAAKQILHKEAFGEMSKEDMDILERAEADDDVFAVADGQKHSDPMIQKLGDALKDYIDPRNALLIRSNAMRQTELNEDRFFRNTYNPSKMLKLGRENWVAMQKSLIDIEKTFKNTKAMDIDGQIDDAIVDQMIGNTYDNVIQGNGPLFTKASVSKDSDAIERSRHMFYKYKDWKSWGMANKAYGQGSLLKSWMMDISGTGNQVGMAEIMGTQPQKMWLKMREVQVAKNPNTALNSIEYQTSDALFNNLLGANKGAYNATIANIGSSIRSWSSMARLGFTTLKSIPDIANAAGVAMRSGNGYWAPFFSAITNAFNLMPGESRVVLARNMSHNLNIHAGTVSRYVDTAGMGDLINRMSNKFFHGIGLEAWDKGSKLSAMDPIMKGYGKGSSKTFSELNNQQQAYLRRFSIEESEWDALRSKTEKNLFSTDNVDNMSDSDIRELWGDTDKSVPLSDYRSTLYRKVFGMFDAAQEFAVLNPTAFSNLMTTWNSRSGTVGGEAIRMIMQFKSYPVQYMRRVFVGGMQDFDSYQGRMMYALNMSLGTIMLSQLSEVLVAIGHGLTPPDPTKMSKTEQLKYYTKVLAGGMGVFGTAMDDKNAAKSLFFTPSIDLLRDPFVSALALVKGDLSGAKSAAKEWAKVANPIGTIPGISPYVDSFLGNKPYIEPGQRPLF